MRHTSPPRTRHPLVHLRPLAAADLVPWFRILSQPIVHEHTSWDVKRPEELAAHLAPPGAPTDSAPIRFAVALRTTDELVGTAGFHTVLCEQASAEIAYELDPRWWGQGIASAVCQDVTAWGHRAAGLARVQATVLLSNTRSARVLARCGFQREGLLRAHRMVRGTPGDFHLYAHTVGRDAA